MNRECRVSDCTTLHPDNQFACRSHWFALPKHLRDAIWTAYREHGPFSGEYEQAAAAAEHYLEATS